MRPGLLSIIALTTHSSRSFGRLMLTSCRVDGRVAVDATTLELRQCAAALGSASARLQHLSLRNTPFATLDACLLSAQLTTLHVEGCGLTSATGLEYLCALDVLKLPDNALTSLTALPPHVSYVDLRNNQLTTLPEPNASLVELELSNNDLTALPNLSGAVRLRSLCVQGNARLETLPASLWTLRHLQRLRVGGTAVAFIPTAVHQLRELRLLSVAGAPVRFAALSLLEVAASGAALEMPHAGASERGCQWWVAVRDLPSNGLFHAGHVDNAALRAAIAAAGLLRGRWAPRLHCLYGRAQRYYVHQLLLLAGPGRPLECLPRELLWIVASYTSSWPEGDEVAPVPVAKLSVGAVVARKGARRRH